MSRIRFHGLPRLLLFSGLLVWISLSACNLPLRLDGLPVSGATATVEENCFYMWASEPRPELSAELLAALEAAGLEGIEAKATALGEDSCDGFGWASTDYEVALWVESLGDRETLGNLFKQTLPVLITFATNPSDTAAVIFNSGNQNISGGEDIIIRFSYGELLEARHQAETESGVALFEALFRIRNQYPIVVPPPAPLAIDVAQGVTLMVPRALHTATWMPHSYVLLVGGSRSPEEFLSEVEFYDPASGLTGQAAPLHMPRHGHTTTLLSDGRLLVVGGYNSSGLWLDDAEVYDPATDTWAEVPPLHNHGVSHTATLMQDGRVLVVGGCIGSGVCTNQVEIFDPQSNTWTDAMPLEGDRGSHTAVALDDGRVLLAGGGAAAGVPQGGDALLYDPQMNTWASTAPMVKPRIFAQSVRLQDGRVLVIGGINLEDTLSGGPNRKMSSSVEIYDPKSNAWTAAADLAQARYAHTATILRDGRVLVSGGARDWDCCLSDSSFVAEIEIYDPGANRWYQAGTLPLPSANAAAVLLSDGRVWVTGGQAGPSNTIVRPETWLISAIPLQP